MAFESLALLQSQIFHLGCQKLALEGLIVLTILKFHAHGRIITCSCDAKSLGTKDI